MFHSSYNIHTHLQVSTFQQRALVHFVSSLWIMASFVRWNKKISRKSLRVDFELALISMASMVTCIIVTYEYDLVKSEQCLDRNGCVYLCIWAMGFFFSVKCFDTATHKWKIYQIKCLKSSDLILFFFFFCHFNRGVWRLYTSCTLFSY